MTTQTPITSLDFSNAGMDDTISPTENMTLMIIQALKNNLLPSSSIGWPLRFLEMSSGCVLPRRAKTSGPMMQIIMRINSITYLILNSFPFLNLYSDMLTHMAQSWIAKKLYVFV